MVRNKQKNKNKNILLSMYTEMGDIQDIFLSGKNKLQFDNIY